MQPILVLYMVAIVASPLMNDSTVSAREEVGPIRSKTAGGGG